MTVHIVKLCVGADSVEDLAAWQAKQIKKRGRPVCGTRMAPKREAEVLAGGSLYWVIKGVIAVRQKIVEVAPVRDDHGLRCGLWLDAKLVRTTPQPRRAFQGWRYLDVKDAPADLAKRSAANLPEELQRKLVELGAW
ncbi:MAG: DUF1489 domain-containing protein [Hydrogenophilaceae bacterium]|jgi:hypothetical protein|nr:DUF1489 domain-containing protein [Hydrogenophilaceae bacterium]